MPFDAVTLYAVKRECESFLLDARLEKIQQPDPNRFLLHMRKANVTRKLLICCNPGSARVHFTESAYENPASAPMFCMLLRKHLGSAVLVGISQPNEDRILRLDFVSRTELGDRADRSVIIELFTRAPNLILCGEDNRIIDCLRRRNISEQNTRPVLPGLFYELPPIQAGRSVLSLTESDVAACADSFCHTEKPEAFFSSCLRGLSPLIQRELTRDGSECFAGHLAALRSCIEAGRFQPGILFDNELPKDFSFLPVRQYGGLYRWEACSDFSSMLDAFYVRRETLQLRRSRSRELESLVNRQLQRLRKKQLEQTSELEKASQREAVRIRGELIRANLYRIHRGDRVLRCENYYDELCPVVEIPLPADRSADRYAGDCFRQYGKMKSAELHLQQQLLLADSQIQYLQSVQDELARAATSADLAEIRQELIRTGFLRPDKEKPKKEKTVSKPEVLRAPSGLEVLVGKNNLQNERLTFQTADRNDLWFHAKNFHGSHVILRCGGAVPGEEDILFAARAAALHSQGGGDCQVDYTAVKKVRKIHGAFPGMVTYTDYHTLTVRPGP